MTQLIFLKFIISRSEHMFRLSNLPDDKYNYFNIKIKII